MYRYVCSYIFLQQKIGSHIPFNFELISKTSMGTTAYEYKANIENWLNGMPKGEKIHANWVVRELNQNQFIIIINIGI